MAARYDELIISTFRDKPIKSVLLIDDQFSPYEGLVSCILKLKAGLSNLQDDIDGKENENLVDEINNVTTEINASLLESDRAKNFTEYFGA